MRLISGVLFRAGGCSFSHGLLTYHIIHLSYPPVPSPYAEGSRGGYLRSRGLCSRHSPPFPAALTSSPNLALVSQLSSQLLQQSSFHMKAVFFLLSSLALSAAHVPLSPLDDLSYTSTSTSDFTDLNQSQLQRDTETLHAAGYLEEEFEKRATSAELYGPQTVALPPVFAYGKNKVRGVSLGGC